MTGVLFVLCFCIIPWETLAAVRNENFDPVYHYVVNVGKDSLYTRIKAFSIDNITRYIYTSEPNRHSYVDLLYVYMYSSDNYNFKSSGRFKIPGRKSIVNFLIYDENNRTGFFRSSIEPHGIVIGHNRGKNNGRIDISTDNGTTWTLVRETHGHVYIDEDNSLQYDQEFDRYIGMMRTNLIMVTKDLFTWETLHYVFPFTTKSLDEFEPDDIFRLAVDGDESNIKWIVLFKLFRPFVGIEYQVGYFNESQYIVESGPHFLEYGPDSYELAIVNKGNCPSQKEKMLMGSIYNVYFEPKLSFFEWKYLMSIPRILQLKTFNGTALITQKPIPQFDDKLSIRYRISRMVLHEHENPLSCFASRTFRIIAVFEMGLATNFGFHIRKGKKERTVIGYNTVEGEFYADRTKSGFPYFVKGAKYSEYAEVYRSKFRPSYGLVKFHILSDVSSVEVFCDEGQIVFSLIVFSSHFSDKMEMFTDFPVIIRDMQIDLYKKEHNVTVCESVQFPCSIANQIPCGILYLKVIFIMALFCSVHV